MRRIDVGLTPAYASTLAYRVPFNLFVFAFAMPFRFFCRLLAAPVVAAACGAFLPAAEPGVVTAEFVVPDLPPGTQTIIARGQTSRTEGVARFEVLPAALTQRG